MQGVKVAKKTVKHARKGGTKSKSMEHGLKEAGAGTGMGLGQANGLNRFNIV
jgi:hypothetical protein